MIPAFRRHTAQLSIVIAVVLTGVYWVRPDWATAITIFPAWMWGLGWGLLLVDIRGEFFRIGTFAWLLFFAVAVEEWKSLGRGLLSADHVADGLTVVSINCAGNMEALQCAVENKPDLVLVQESPAKSGIEKLAASMEGYGCLWGVDASIMARGEIREVVRKPFFTAGWANLRGRWIFVVSLRLATSDLRFDLWNPECWRSQIGMRERQRLQMSAVRNFLPDGNPVIVGGDCNVPQGDGIFSCMKGDYKDTFSESGEGWGNTIVEECPVVRIDQIWVNRGWKSIRVRARRNEGTDHRRVEAVLGWPPEAK